MKKRSTEQIIFPIIVGVLSAINILQNIQAFYWTSVVVSLIGLTGTGLFFLNNKKAGILFYVWIVLQLVTYSNEQFTYFTNQFPYISIGFTFRGTHTLFALNFLPFFYFIGYRLLQMYDLIGKKVSIKPIKAESGLKAMEGEIIAIMNRNDGKWLKVKLSDDGSPEQKLVIIKPKGEERFSRKSSILAFVKEGSGDYPFIDWGKVKLM